MQINKTDSQREVVKYPDTCGDDDSWHKAAIMEVQAGSRWATHFVEIIHSCRADRLDGDGKNTSTQKLVLD